MTQNVILDRASPEDRLAAEDIARLVDMDIGDRLEDPEVEPRHIYWPTSGVISSVLTLPDGHSVETGMVGPEGVTDSKALDRPRRGLTTLIVQTKGRAWRMRTHDFQQLLAARPDLRRAVRTFESRIHVELEQTCACNAVHTAEQRLAKWLLRFHDRIEGDVLHLNQEFLAVMTGVQRTTVNEAAQTLRRAGALKYLRGKITILSRARLRTFACDCYDALGVATAVPPKPI